MGNSTGSTMYMFGAVIVIYIVGMLIYQGVQWIKKKREQKKDRIAPICLLNQILENEYSFSMNRLIDGK